MRHTIPTESAEQRVKQTHLGDPAADQEQSEGKNAGSEERAE